MRRLHQHLCVLQITHTAGVIGIILKTMQHFIIGWIKKSKKVTFWWLSLLVLRLYSSALPSELSIHVTTDLRRYVGGGISDVVQCCELRQQTVHHQEIWGLK